MALLTATAISRAGADPVPATAASGGGDTVNNYGRQFFIVKNGGIAPITVTLVITATVDTKAVTNPTVSVTNGTSKVIGPFPPSIYSTSGTVGNPCGITYSDVTSVTVGAFTLTPE